AARAEGVADWSPEAPAEDAVAAAGSWVVVRDPTSLPVPGSRIPEPPYGRVLVAGDAGAGPPAHVPPLGEVARARAGAGPAAGARAGGAGDESSTDRGRGIRVLAGRPSSPGRRERRGVLRPPPGPRRRRARGGRRLPRAAVRGALGPGASGADPPDPGRRAED